MKIIISILLIIGVIVLQLKYLSKKLDTENRKAAELYNQDEEQMDDL